MGRGAPASVPAPNVTSWQLVQGASSPACTITIGCSWCRVPLLSRYAAPLPYAPAYPPRENDAAQPRAHTPHPWPSSHTGTPQTGTEQHLTCPVGSHHPHNHSGRLCGPHTCCAPCPCFQRIRAQTTSPPCFLAQLCTHTCPPTPDTGSCLQVRYNYTNETSPGVTVITDESECALVRRNGDALLWWDGIDSTIPDSDSDNCPRCVPVCVPPGTHCLCAALVLCGTVLCFVWGLRVTEQHTRGCAACMSYGCAWHRVHGNPACACRGCFCGLGFTFRSVAGCHHLRAWQRFHRGP